MHQPANLLTQFQIIFFMGKRFVYHIAGDVKYNEAFKEQPIRDLAEVN